MRGVVPLYDVSLRCNGAQTHVCCRDRSSGQGSIRPIFVGKPIPKLDRFLSMDKQQTAIVRAVTGLARKLIEPVIDTHVMARTRRRAPESDSGASTEPPGAVTATLISADWP